MKSTLILCAFVAFFYNAGAQHIIKGHITDNEGNPLAGATVYLPDINKGTLADSKGYYIVSDLPSGKIRISFSYLGYTNRIESVLTDSTTKNLDVSLEASTIRTEEIIISSGYSSTQHENAVRIEALKMVTDDIKPTNNLAEIITKVPGVSMISKGSGVSKPVIRGLSMNDILVLNNGVRFENYQYSDHHPLGIDEFGIDDIEIIKGPASLLYGSDAIGGVINFIRERPATTGSFEGDYNMQLFSNSLGMTNNFGLKGSSGHLSGGIRIGGKTNADYLQGGGDYVPNSRFRDLSVKLNTGYSGKAGTFRLYYDYNDEQLGLAEPEAIEGIGSRGRRPGIFYQQFKTHMLSSQNKIFAGRTRLDINTAYQSTELVHFGEADSYEIQMRLGTLTYEARLHLPSDEKSEYIVGYQGMYQDNLNLNDRETKLLPDAETVNNSLFFLLQKSLWSKVKFQTGLRFDARSIETRSLGTEGEAGYRPALGRSYSSVSGSAGATYNYSEKLLFRANIASAFRTPNLAELTSNGQHETRYETGDKDLKPEKSYEPDLSLHYHLDNFTIDLAAYYNHINDYIFLAPTGDTTTTGVYIYRYRQGDSRLYGAEAGLHFHPQSMKWLHLLTTYSSVRGELLKGTWLPFIPAGRINSEARWEKEQLKSLRDAYVMLSATYTFRQDRTVPEETATADYFLLDLTMGASLPVRDQKITISAGITNLFDKKYIDHLSTLKEVGYFNPGRNFTLTLRIPFQGRISSGKDENAENGR